MLPCVCSVIDHRWRQNVVTKKWHWCSYHILNCSVIYYWIRRTATWNLFVLYNNEKPTTEKAFHFEIFQKRAIWRNLLSMHNEAFSLVVMRSKESWLVRENHATVTLGSTGPFSWDEIENFYTAKAELKVKCDHRSKFSKLSNWKEETWKKLRASKQNWSAKFTILRENAGEVKLAFVIRAELWAEKLCSCLEYCRS